MPRPLMVACDMQRRELALAEETVIAFEPAGRDIMNVLGKIANNMVVDIESETLTTGYWAFTIQTTNLNRVQRIVDLHGIDFKHDWKFR